MSVRIQKVFSRSFFAAALLLAIACSEEPGTGIPTVPPPDNGGGTDLPSDPNSDPRLPELLNKAVELKLTDSVNYAGLKDLATTVFLPIVETFVALEINRGREADVTGAIMVGFEDNEGFWGGVLNTFPKASQRSSDMLDMIFSDSELTVRMVSGLNGDTMVTPTVYYRLRQSGEKQCQARTLVCTQTSWQWDPWKQEYKQVTKEVACPADVPQPTAEELGSECRSYMNLGSSSVKKLGTFESKYSKWVK